MAYIAKVNVPAGWTELATLTGSAFSSGKKYSIQAYDGSNVRLCNSTSLPTDDFAGENIKNLMQVIYSPDAGTLYVKRGSANAAFVSVSEIG